ncbi:hypothetical protein ACAW74_16850 [Fibrella sp. WM1]|uniref:hypothetical protein n=1 Tax=Fibrella musci TaxID=3242485 RepID=UPI0035202E78
MLKQLVFILSYLNSATLLLPIGVGLFRWKGLSTALRLSWAALLAYFLLFLLSLSVVLLRLTPSNTLGIQYLIAGTFGSFFSLAYWSLIPAGKRRIAVAVLGGLGLLGILTEALIQGRYAQSSQWSVPLQTVLTTLICLLYLHLLLRQTRVSLLRVPFFWITISLLVSSVLGTFYDAFRNLMLASSIELLMGWLCFQLGITILCNGLYAIGFNRATTHSA